MKTINNRAFAGVCGALWVVTLLGFVSQSVAKSVPYSEGKEKFVGQYFEAKTAAKKQPSIVMIHNWMGITAETEKQAKRFQKLGYSVFAADIYGEGVRPKDQKEAGALATRFKTDRSLLRKRVALAVRELFKMKGIDPDQVVVVGYCFGGTAAIEAARGGENIRGVISFHGGLDSPTPANGAKIKAKILALHGADDPYVPAKDVEAFESEMKAHHIQYELIKFPGAVHSFTEVGAGTDNSKGAAYNKDADQKSFDLAQDFLAKIK